MASITIITTAEEQERVLKVLRPINGITIAVSEIARRAQMNPNRARYVITDLEAAGKIERVPTKATNMHYIRYAYRVKDE